MNGGVLTGTRLRRTGWLRPEVDGDRNDKKSGIVAEIQTGDADFDASVFIDTSTPDNVVRRVLSDRARSAVLRLIRLPGAYLIIDAQKGWYAPGFSTLPDGVVGLFLTSDVPDVCGDPGDFVLTAMADLLIALPPVTTTKGRAATPDSTTLVKALTAVAGLAIVPMTLTCAVHTDDGRGQLRALGGLISGGLGGWGLARLLLRPIRGRSDSGAVRREGTIAIVVIFACVVSALCRWVFA